jgi:hypothetical protein
VIYRANLRRVSLFLGSSLSVCSRNWPENQDKQLLINLLRFTKMAWNRFVFPTVILTASCKHYARANCAARVEGWGFGPLVHAFRHLRTCFPNGLRAAGSRRNGEFRQAKSGRLESPPAQRPPRGVDLISGG